MLTCAGGERSWGLGRPAREEHGTLRSGSAPWSVLLVSRPTRPHTGPGSVSSLCYRGHHGLSSCPGRNLGIVLNSSRSCAVYFQEDTFNSELSQFSRTKTMPTHSLDSILTAACLGPISFSSSVTKQPPPLSWFPKSESPAPPPFLCPPPRLPLGSDFSGAKVSRSLCY